MEDKQLGISSVTEYSKSINCDYPHLIVKLKTNLAIQGKVQFYSRLKKEQLETLLIACFQENSLDHKEKLFLSTLLKKYSFIVGIAFSDLKFNFARFFNFIKAGYATYEKLSVMEEIMVPYAKQCPQNFLQMLSLNKQIKRIFTSYIFNKSIFKITYTTVFCLEKCHLKNLELISKEMIECMVESIFVFHPDQTSIAASTKKLMDYVQVTCNLKELLVDLHINMASVDIGPVEFLVKSFNKQKIERIFCLFDKYKSRDECQQYCEGILLVLLHLMKLLEVLKYSNNQKIKQKQQKAKSRVEGLLCEIVHMLGQKMSYFIDYLINNDPNGLHYSSGEIITRVGMIKYRILQIIQKILSINQVEDVALDFFKFDLFEMIERFIGKYKWNNIVQNLLVKITELIISQDYANFKRRYIDVPENYLNGFFAGMIANFRNRKYVFLETIKMTNLGNRQSIYQISKTIINEMLQKNDLNFVLENFQHLQNFIEKDMKDYEISNRQISTFFDDKAFQKLISQHSNEIRQTHDTQLYHIRKPLERIGQIIKNLECEKQWDSKETLSTQQKQNLMKCPKMKTMDSMKMHSSDNY